MPDDDDGGGGGGEDDDELSSSQWAPERQPSDCLFRRAAERLANRPYRRSSSTLVESTSSQESSVDATASNVDASDDAAAVVLESLSQLEQFQSLVSTSSKRLHGIWRQVAAFGGSADIIRSESRNIEVGFALEPADTSSHFVFRIRKD